MMAAATLFGFLGVLLAVPLGAVVKILVGRATTVYLDSDFYRRPPEVAVASMSEESMAELSEIKKGSVLPSHTGS
jgi:hypothetical protein